MIHNVEIPKAWSEPFTGGIKHPELYLWDAWSFERAGSWHLFCLAVNRFKADASPLQPFERNAFPFHIRQFISSDKGASWQDAGVFQRSGEAKDGHDSRSIWSGGVLPLATRGVLSAYTGIRQLDADHPFLQSLAVAASRDGAAVKPGSQSLLLCPQRDENRLRQAGYYFASREQMGSAAGEESGPVLAWRDPALFYDRLSDQSPLYTVWAAKACQRKPAVGMAKLRRQDDADALSRIEVEELFPPIHLPDESEYSQIECPKILCDKKNGRYILLVATTTRYSEGQPDSEVSKKNRMYVSEALTGPWRTAGSETSCIAGIENQFGIEVLSADFDRNELLCVAAYTEAAEGDLPLTFSPAFSIDISDLENIASVSATN